MGYSSEEKQLDAETLRKYIFGGHVAEYMENLQVGLVGCLGVSLSCTIVLPEGASFLVIEWDANTHLRHQAFNCCFKSVEHSEACMGYPHVGVSKVINTLASPQRGPMLRCKLGTGRPCFFFSIREVSDTASEHCRYCPCNTVYVAKQHTFSTIMHRSDPDDHAPISCGLSRSAAKGTYSDESVVAQEESPEKYATVFANYAEKDIDPDDLEDLYKQVGAAHLDWCMARYMGSLGSVSRHCPGSCWHNPNDYAPSLTCMPRLAGRTLRAEHLHYKSVQASR